MKHTIPQVVEPQTTWECQLLPFFRIKKGYGKRGPSPTGSKGNGTLTPRRVLVLWGNFIRVTDRSLRTSGCQLDSNATTFAEPVERLDPTCKRKGQDE